MLRAVHSLASLEEHVNGRRHTSALRQYVRDHGRNPIRPIAIRDDDDDGDTWIRTDTTTIPAAAVTVVNQEEEQISKVLRFDPPDDIDRQHTRRFVDSGPDNLP